MNNNITTIAFDPDDTLWVNEHIFITLQAENHGEVGFFSLYALVRNQSLNFFFVDF